MSARGVVTVWWTRRRMLAGAAILLVFAVSQFTATGDAAAQSTSQPLALHGADAVFASGDVAVVWAVLKQPTADKPDRAAVWLRVVNLAGKFSHVAIDGVDPFSKKRERLAKGVALGAEARIEADRDSFAEFTSREIHLYRSEADWRADKPALTVYYLGVPDTTPEFSSREAMDRYLAKAKLVSHHGGALKRG